MLQKATVNSSVLELLTILMSDEFVKDFVLVGGTALTLQLGHRISVDIDLFSDRSFDETKLADHFRSNYEFVLDFISNNTVKGEINGVQIDCIAHQYPWICPPNLEENFRLASINDIAAMKLNAISGNGTRIKDFIDIAFLSCKISFKDMLGFYEMKYNSNGMIPIKAMAYFEDINFNEPVMLVDSSLNWGKIEKRLKSMIDYPDRIFKELID